MKRKINSRSSQGGRKSENSRLGEAGVSQKPMNGDQTEYLCSPCQQIDFLSIAKIAESDLPCRVCALKHIHSDLKCSLCGFLCRMQPPAFLVRTPHLVAVSAKSLFTISKAAQVNSYVLLAVGQHSQRRIYENLEFFGIAQTDSQQLSVRKISEKLSWELPLEWLNFCRTHHKLPCNGYTGLEVANLRVISCHTREILPLPRSSTPYVALSYLWGNNQDDNQRSYDQLPPRAPNTIEDAISVTLRLGYDYLWVDRYCIRQTHASEKDGLIRDMGQIYKNSALTIVAASGKCPAHGLPGVSRLRIHQGSLKVGEAHLISMSNTKKEIDSTRWNTRGWTYQEGLLSRRRLVFTDQQIYFQCSNMHCFEALTIPLPKLHTENSARFPERINLSRVFPTRDAGKWPCEIFNRIREYRKRHLSFEEDALPAFLGILSQFESSISHMQGLPILPPVAYGIETGTRDPIDIASASIIHALLWNGPDSDRTMRRRQSCPSWSWVGWRSSDDNTALTHWSPYDSEMYFTKQKEGYVRSVYNLTIVPIVDILVEQ